jgi:poly-beta-hydroxybutyrate-responsive repressor
MSNKKPIRKRKESHPSRGKQERYIQPSILLSLYLHPSYGYEIIKNIQRFGFVEGHAPPGMIYRHLRQLEEDGLVLSEWKTEDTGPAKRMYCITTEGIEVLSLWVEYMERQADNLHSFIEHYRKEKRKRPKPGRLRQ